MYIHVCDAKIWIKAGTHRIELSGQDAAPVASVKGSAAWGLGTVEQIWASTRHTNTRHHVLVAP